MLCIFLGIRKTERKAPVMTRRRRLPVQIAIKGQMKPNLHEDGRAEWTGKWVSGPHPAPVNEHYVRNLLLSSSCFRDPGGRPNVCQSNPCACAQSLLQEIGRPLELKIRRFRSALEFYATATPASFDNGYRAAATLETE